MAADAREVELISGAARSVFCAFTVTSNELQSHVGAGGGVSWLGITLTVPSDW